MSKLFPHLSYRDVDWAITWLEALGFETTRRQQDDGGATVHAELRLGDAVVMVAPADEPYETPKLIGRSTGQPWFARPRMRGDGSGRHPRRIPTRHQRGSRTTATTPDRSSRSPC